MKCLIIEIQTLIFKEEESSLNVSAMRMKSFFSAIPAIIMNIVAH